MLARMGLLSTRWETDYEGVHLTVNRNEVTKGFWIEGDGRILAERRWSWIGTGDLEADLEVGGRTVRLHATLPLSFPRSRCVLRADGRDLPLRQIK